jgi:hypothetical protein|eukprot:COSAG01_NODE_2944_length_6814_cov_144.052271_4_plen_41_part_00
MEPLGQSADMRDVYSVAGECNALARGGLLAVHDTAVRGWR